MPQRDHIDVLAFRAGPRRFVVDVRRVAGLMGRPPLRAAAAQREGLLGYVQWRGGGLAVFSLAVLLKGAPSVGESESQQSTPTPHARVVVLHTPSGPIGLWVDEAEQVLPLNPAACVAEPLAGAVPSPWSLGLCHVRGQLYAMLDPRALADALAGHPVGTQALVEASQSSPPQLSDAKAAR